MAPALLSRSLDPALGVITGVLAFYLNQTNPRTAPPPGESLNNEGREEKLREIKNSYVKNFSATHLTGYLPKSPVD
ncbi:hypothetical protein PNOK_0113400 [Pyrrhoderma noxium]|uniref:Uncharacterized protein n=1 Tax=Pyrrhoderma noxium TaxID=2282107 RepID=A0A286UWU5_9AGAM|nr:hypothetical protein PNOK_0113400 [Pyrrhoderma noxium]